VRGWDFVNQDNDPFDDNGHGTHVSGTIGAEGNNSSGVIGVNWQVRIMPLKFLNSGGSGDIAAATSAILYAASFKDAGGANVVRVTNNSWSGG
jgi:subtilisin family serine protease